MSNKKTNNSKKNNGLRVIFECKGVEQRSSNTPTYTPPSMPNIKPAKTSKPNKMSK